MDEVTVHELSDRPTDFWRQWKKTANVMRLQVNYALKGIIPNGSVTTGQSSPLIAKSIQQNTRTFWTHDAIFISFEIYNIINLGFIVYVLTGS